MAGKGFLSVEGCYLKWTDAFGTVSTYVGTQQGIMGKIPGYTWIQGEQVCYVDALGEVRCFSPGIAVQEFWADLLASVSQTAIVAVAQSIPKSAAVVTVNTNDKDMTTKELPTAVAVATAIAVDQSDSSSAEPVTADTYNLWSALGGAVRDFGGSQTDETAGANNDTANDITLLRAAPVTGDYYYFGLSTPPEALWINMGTNGAGVWSLLFQYWNGAWANLSGVSDTTNGWRVGAGLYVVSWTLPVDWALSTIQGMELYWIAVRLDAFTSISVQPKGTRAWLQYSHG